MGAGRPKGSLNKNKKRIKDYFSELEIRKLVGNLKKEAKTNPDIMKFLAEQIFGKAIQPVDSKVEIDIGDETKKIVDKCIDSYLDNEKKQRL